MKHIPNIITILRFLGAALLLLCSPAGAAFWIIYGLCGVGDMLDGYLARKLHAASKTGAVLDSVADICFVACCEQTDWSFALPLCPCSVLDRCPPRSCRRCRLICRRSGRPFNQDTQVLKKDYAIFGYIGLPAWFCDGRHIRISIHTPSSQEGSWGGE